jgi:hypothetical protein
MGSVSTSWSLSSFFGSFNTPFTKVVALLAGLEFVGSAMQVLGIIYAGSGVSFNNNL